ncbi:MAG: hypothetical protein ACLTW9_07000 [Enterocloster sp.]
MGKQINYWMDYDNFLLVAQMAVDLGCTVVKEDLKIGKVIESKDAGIITPMEHPIIQATTSIFRRQEP